MVTHDGYFREYTINTTKSNESSWVLEREFSLLDSTLKKKEQLTFQVLPNQLLLLTDVHMIHKMVGVHRQRAWPDLAVDWANPV